MGESEQHRRDLTRLARGGVLNMFGAGAAGVFGFALAVIVARGLGTEGSGIFFAVVALVNIVGVVAELGAPSGLVRQISRFRAIRRSRDIAPSLTVAIAPVAALGLLIGSGMYVAAPTLGELIAGDEGGDTAAAYLRVIGPFVVVSACGHVVIRAFQGFGQMLPVVLLQNIVQPALRTLLCGAAVLAGLSATAIGFSWAVPMLVVLVVAVPWLRRRVGSIEPADEIEPRLTSRALASDFWRFTSFQAVATIVQIVLLRLDVLLLSAISSAKDAGIYAAASRYLTLGVMVSTAIVFVVGPQLSGMIAQHAFDRARGVYQAATLWLSAVSFPVYLALAVFAPLMMELFGEEFSEGATALVILSSAMLVNMGTGAVRSALFMGGKSSWILFDNAAALAVNVALNLLLIPELGMTGAAIAWAASILVGNLLPAWQGGGFGGCSRSDPATCP